MDITLNGVVINWKHNDDNTEAYGVTGILPDNKDTTFTVYLADAEEDNWNDIGFYLIGSQYN